MARRLALLALLACAAAARPPPRSEDVSDSEPLDPFALWDEYEESFETTTTTSPRPTTTKPSAKVILRGKLPKVNVTVKNPQKEDSKKKVIKATHINIESHTNFIVTKRPLLSSNLVTKRPQRPALHVGGDYLWLDGEEVAPVVATRATTKRPPAPRPVPTRRPPSPRRTTTNRPPTTTRRRPAAPTRRPAPPVRRTNKPTKAPVRII